MDYNHITPNFDVHNFITENKNNYIVKIYTVNICCNVVHLCDSNILDANTFVSRYNG